MVKVVTPGMNWPWRDRADADGTEDLQKKASLTLYHSNQWRVCLGFVALEDNIKTGPPCNENMPINPDQISEMDLMISINQAWYIRVLTLCRN